VSKTISISDDLSTPYAGEAGILLHMFGRFMILKLKNDRPCNDQKKKKRRRASNYLQNVHKENNRLN
jgi:hypothetical protein